MTRHESNRAYRERLISTYCAPHDGSRTVDTKAERHPFMTALGLPASERLGRPSVIGVWVTIGSSDKIRWSCLFRHMFAGQKGIIVPRKGTVINWRIFAHNELLGVRFEPETHDLLPGGFATHNIHGDITELAMLE